MKAVFLVILVFGVTLARGQSTSTNAPVVHENGTNAPAFLQPDPFSVELSKSFQKSAITPLQPKPNEMTLGRVQASGSAIEAAKTKQPLKLLNPFSPPTNSSPEDNVVRDPFTGKVNGLKVFAIHF